MRDHLPKVMTTFTFQVLSFKYNVGRGTSVQTKELEEGFTMELTTDGPIRDITNYVTKEARRRAAEIEKCGIGQIESLYLSFSELGSRRETLALPQEEKLSFSWWVILLVLLALFACVFLIASHMDGQPHGTTL